MGIHFPTVGWVINKKADLTPIWLPGGVRGGWGVPEVQEAFVTSLYGYPCGGWRPDLRFCREMKDQS